jgi:hypothetical protein
MNEISQALTRLFERHRIIFWYDAKEELGAEYEALTLCMIGCGGTAVLGDNYYPAAQASKSCH